MVGWLYPPAPQPGRALMSSPQKKMDFYAREEKSERKFQKKSLEQWRSPQWG
jgi:hypothetical protein